MFRAHAENFNLQRQLRVPSRETSRLREDLIKVRALLKAEKDKSKTLQVKLANEVEKSSVTNAKLNCSSPRIVNLLGVINLHLAAIADSIAEDKRKWVFKDRDVTA